MKLSLLHFSDWILTILVALLLISGCATSQSTDDALYPAWVDDLIAQLESEPVRNPPASITRFNYLGQQVYYVPPFCCDQFSVLYDSTGAVLCAPDGGITGSGDGRCSDFFAERTDEHTIWRDNRTE
jgi:hypothetical protein